MSMEIDVYVSAKVKRRWRWSDNHRERERDGLAGSWRGRREREGNLDGEGASGLVNEVGRCEHML